MAGAILNSDRISSRRRWIIALIVFLIIAITLGAASRHHLGRPHELAFPVHDSDVGHSKLVEIKEFVKPKDVTIVGLVFYGRKNRVEMLRCYLEVSASLSYNKACVRSNVYPSAILSTMVAGWMRYTGSKTRTRRQTLITWMKFWRLRLDTKRSISLGKVLGLWAMQMHGATLNGASYTSRLTTMW